MQTRIILWLLVFILPVFGAGCEQLLEEEEADNAAIDFEFPSKPSNLESSTVSRVVDGDTLDLSDGRRIRLIGVNTPERNQPYYQEASAFLRNEVEGDTVGIEYDVETTDIYGRTLAYIWKGERMVNLDIILQGYANAFTVPPNVKYDTMFVDAERAARTSGAGLWEQGATGLEITAINADAPGRDDQNPNGEWVDIVNNGDSTVNLGGFTLSDESRKTYTFRSLTLAPGQTVRVYSGCGQDTRAELYWCLDGTGDAVWNNSGDAAFIRDADGLFVTSYSY